MIGAPRVSAIQNNLRRKVQRRATHSVRLGYDPLRKAKINDYCIPVTDDGKDKDKEKALGPAPHHVNKVRTLCCRSKRSASKQEKTCETQNSCRNTPKATKTNLGFQVTVHKQMPVHVAQTFRDTSNVKS